MGQNQRPANSCKNSNTPYPLSSLPIPKKKKLPSHLMGIHHAAAGAWATAAKPCDSCKIASSALFCRADFAFLCLSCDAKIHAANKLSTRHERVWLCEVCEQAPAVVTCKADAAALCVTCDADIHSANTLAGRHERVPVESFFDSAESVVKSAGFNFLLLPNEHGNSDDGEGDGDAETASWLIPNLNSANSKGVDLEMKSGNMFFSEMDQFLDFDYSNSLETKYQPENDSVVPVQKKINQTSENYFDIDFCRSKLSSFSYTNPSLNRTVSSCSHDVGIVPDGNSISDVSPPIYPTANQAIQLSGLDREARVLRYKEKRKNRKFEKTIRYASRKAYAETRPRIKGRFAKRNKQMEEEVGELYNGSEIGAFIDDNQYCVVPSF